METWFVYTDCAGYGLGRVTTHLACRRFELGQRLWDSMGTFALLVIGANMHFLLGVDEEKRKTLERVRRAKMQQWQMKWDKKADKGSMQ